MNEEEFPHHEDMEEDLRGRLPPFVDVSVFKKDRMLRIVVSPKEEFEARFSIFKPLSLEVKSHEAQSPVRPEMSVKERAKARKKQREVYSDILRMVSTDLARYLKPPAIIDFEELIPVVKSRHRAVEVFSYLCQANSPYHCNFLFSYLMQLVSKSCLPENIDSVPHFAAYLEVAGFPKTAYIIREFISEELPETILGPFPSMIEYGLKQIFSSYATIYLSPMDMPEEDIKESWYIIDRVCPIPEYKYFPTTYNETSILDALKTLSDPELSALIESVTRAPVETPLLPKVLPKAPPAEPEERVITKEEESKEDILKRLKIYLGK